MGIILIRLTKSNIRDKSKGQNMLYDRGDVFYISTFFTVMQETILDPVKSV